MKDEILGLPEEETRSGSTSRHRKGTAEAEVSGGIFLLMLPLFPALALRVKRRYGALVLKQQRMLPDGALSK